jgi:hypothetical protein
MIASVVRRFLFLFTSLPALAASVTLQWDPSPDAGIAKYVLHRGTASRVYDWITSVPISSTSVIVTNLVAGQIYYFSATAFDTNGVESDFSNEISYTPSVIASNSLPVAVSFSMATMEDQAVSSLLRGTDADSDPLSYQIATQPAHGAVSVSGNSVIYTPAANYFGTDQFTYTASDGKSLSAPATVTISVQAVNDPPTLNAIGSVVINEDAPAQTISLSGISAGPGESQTLSVTATVSVGGAIGAVAVNYSSPNSTGTLSFTPIANASGTNVITVTVNDGQASNNLVSRSFTVVVNPVNDAPTLYSIADLTIPQNAGTQSVSLSGISSGAPDEVQTLTITATSSNPALIPNPVVNYTSPNTLGNLQYTPAPNQSGTATITVTLNDGGAINNLISQAFKVTVQPAISNSPPVAASFSMATTEDQGVSSLLRGTDADSDPLTYQIATQPAHGALSLSGNSVIYTPAADYFGTDQFTYTTSDGKSVSAPATVTIGVQAVNDPPTLNAIGSVVINEDAPTQTISLSGISAGAAESQALSVTATVSSGGAVGAVAVNYSSPNSTGTLTFTPIANASGTNVITVTVNDGQATNNVVSRSFTVVVNPVNDTPTLNSITDITIPQNAGTQSVSLSGITSGAPEENQTLAVTASSSNPTLIPNLTVNYTSPNTSGNLQFAPAANQSGSAIITVSVNDGGASNNLVTRTFNVTVQPPPAVTGLTETASDARSLTFAWATDQSSTCVLNYGTTTNLGYSLAPTTGSSHSVTLSNLQPATTYFVQVNVSGAAGASQTAVQTAVTEPARVLLFSAEAATVTAPMAIVSSPLAQNGKYLTSALDNLGTAAFSLATPFGLNYRVWARVNTLLTGGSFFVSLDGSPERAAPVANTALGQWRWVLLADSSAAPLVLPMNDATHLLSLRAGTANTSLDELAIVNDPLWQPILPTTKPRLTMTFLSGSTVDLNWSVNAGNATNIAIEQSQDGIIFRQIAVVPATQTTYRVMGLKRRRDNYFRVSAYNSVDRTDYSNVTNF